MWTQFWDKGKSQNKATFGKIERNESMCKSALSIVYLLTTGDGSDGNEWSLHGIYSTEQRAKEALAVYQMPRPRPDGSFYVPDDAKIEEWPIDSYE